MNAITRHVSRCFVAGIVALLPIGGLVGSVAYVEYTLYTSGLAELPFYFPGLGLVVVGLVVYLLGLLVSTLVGKWLFARVDRFLGGLPTLGSLYATLKQILGYGAGRDAVFHGVALVPSREHDALELGLVTGETTGDDGMRRVIVFLPGAPNPSNGRLILVAPELIRRVEMPVSEALKALLSVGKTQAE